MGLQAYAENTLNYGFDPSDYDRYPLSYDGDPVHSVEMMLWVSSHLMGGD